MDLSHDEALVNYVSEIINKMPKSPNRDGFNRLLASNLGLIDITAASVNILSIISGLITIGDFTYRLWQYHRKKAIQQTMNEIASVNGECSENNAEALIAEIFKLLSKQYPPTLMEDNDAPQMGNIKTSEE